MNNKGWLKNVKMLLMDANENLKKLFHTLVLYVLNYKQNLYNWKKMFINERYDQCNNNDDNDNNSDNDTNYSNNKKIIKTHIDHSPV